MKAPIQTIKSLSGRPEYALIPYQIYQSLRREIEKQMALLEDEWLDFQAEDYIQNPVALMRMKAGMKQAELAKKMSVSQAYISKIEREDCKVTRAIIEKVKKAIGKK